MTREVNVDAVTCGAGDLRDAAKWLHEGGVVIFPTDTFYGIAADPRRVDAVEAIFALKGRQADVAMPLIAAETAQVEAATGPLTARELKVVQHAWPGPLSLVRPAPGWIADGVHAGRGTVAIRVPDHAVARALAEACGVPVTATSANRSGQPPADRVESLGPIAVDARVFVIDAGPTAGGAPSTLVDVRADPPQCLREGAVPWHRVVNWLLA